MRISLHDGPRPCRAGACLLFLTVSSPTAFVMVRWCRGHRLPALIALAAVMCHPADLFGCPRRGYSTSFAVALASPSQPWVYVYTHFSMGLVMGHDSHITSRHINSPAQPGFDVLLTGASKMHPLRLIRPESRRSRHLPALLSLLPLIIVGLHPRARYVSVRKGGHFASHLLACTKPYFS